MSHGRGGEGRGGEGRGEEGRAIQKLYTRILIDLTILIPSVGRAYHLVYNTNVHSDLAEDKYIGAIVNYFDILQSSALNYLIIIQLRPSNVMA